MSRNNHKFGFDRRSFVGTTTTIINNCTHIHNSSICEHFVEPETVEESLHHTNKVLVPSLVSVALCHAEAVVHLIVPEIVEPEKVEEIIPEIVEPELVEPEIVEPEIVEPELVEPEIVEPELVELEIAPEIVEPENVEPEIVEPEKVEEILAPEIVMSLDTSTLSVAEIVEEIELTELQSKRAVSALSKFKIIKAKYSL